MQEYIILYLACFGTDQPMEIKTIGDNYDFIIK